MFVSPPLAVDLTNLPFACLEVETRGPDGTGHIDFTTAAGAGSVTFQPLGNGRPTLIAGVTSDQWTGTLRRLALSFSGDGRMALKKIVLADRAVGTPWLYLRDLAAGRAKLRPGREETVIAAVKNLGGEAENVRLRLRAPAGLKVLGDTEQNFEAACRDAKALVDAKPANRWDRRLVVFDNWTEFGEGHYIEPTSGLGFSFLNAVKRVFCTSWASEAATDIVPEDVGLDPPQRRYEQVRAGFGHRMPWQPRRITGDLVAHWECERIVDGGLADSSPNDSALVVTDMSVEPGRGDHVLRCGEGEATCPAPAPFFHTGGITVALWCKPDEPNQSDHWMLNTVGRSTTGYRLGLGGGCPVWQIPQTAWSHGIRIARPLPIGHWSHLAGTYDNRVMRLYLNGVEIGTLERTGFINPSDNVVVGGYGVGFARARFHGWLDDVRIYRRVLSPAEIAALAQIKGGE